MNSLVSLQNVRRVFQMGETTVEALRGVEAEIVAGEFVAIWGPSGSGKSTLLNIIGLIDSPTEGRMIFDGEDVSHLKDKQLSDYRNRMIGFVFQSFNLIPVLTALENVMMPLQIAGTAQSVARKRALEALESTGLSRFADFNTEKLSGGQRQRVAIARALVGQPRIIIADEPTANLDSVTSTSLIDLMQRINAETKVTFVFSTHDPRLLERVPRHLAMEDGLLRQDQYSGRKEAP
jgi:putative ABC transport system ATP-binding protein